MSGWRDVSVRDLCVAVVDCVNKTAPIVDHETPYKMIRTTNVRNGWVDTSSVRYVDEETFSRWTRRGRPQRGDVILTREAPLGEVGILRSDDLIFLGQRLVMYRADPERCDARFLAYAMLGPRVQAELRSLGSGATVEHLRVPDCEALTIPTPTLAVQRRIGAVLGSIDDLIENSRRRVEVLEEMARAIYQEWFVRFRYPGHEDVPLVDSPLGPIPDQWTVLPSSEVLDINPRVPLTRGTRCRHFAMGDLDERVMNCEPSGWKDSPTGSKFVNGDTLFARITPCLENGKTGFVQALGNGEAACGSTEFVVLRGRLVGPSFTYLLARHDDFRGHAIASMSGASGRQRVRNECFGSFLVPTPPEEIAAAFEAVTTPLFRQSWALHRQAATLASLRDLLMPKLVTGQIDVSQLDLDALTEAAIA